MFTYLTHLGGFEVEIPEIQKLPTTNNFIWVEEYHRRIARNTSSSTKLPGWPPCLSGLASLPWFPLLLKWGQGGVIAPALQGYLKIEWVTYFWGFKKLPILKYYMLSHFSHVWLFVTLWTVIHQAPMSMGFSRQEYWSGLQCPSPEGLPDPGMEPTSLLSPVLAGEFLTTSTTWEAQTLSVL